MLASFSASTSSGRDENGTEAEDEDEKVVVVVVVRRESNSMTPSLKVGVGGVISKSTSLLPLLFVD